MGAHVESADSVNWECGAETPSRYKTRRLWTAQENFWSDLYAHFLDHSNRFIGIYLCGCGGLVARSCLTLVTPWTVVACQAPLSMRFSREEPMEWVAMVSFRGSSQPRDRACVSWVSCVVGRLLTLKTPHERLFLKPISLKSKRWGNSK